MSALNKSDSVPNTSGMIKGREVSNKKLYVHALDGLRGLAV